MLASSRTPGGKTSSATGVELDPKNRSAQNGLSIALMQLKEIDAGIAQCRKALEIDPLNSGAHNILGSLLLSRAIGPSKAVDQKLVTEAVSHIQKALDLEPNYACSWQSGACIEPAGKNE